MSEIEHKGIIRKIHLNYLEVEISVGSACEKCHLKGGCQGSNQNKDRIVDAEINSDETYEIGEKIKLCFSEKDGLVAVVWAYITPIIISLLSLITMTYVNVSEPVAALISLVVIVTYFIILYIFRRKIKGKIKIKVEKIAI